MSIDLVVVGNHKIDFKSKVFNEISMEIKERLDNTTLPNFEFLKLSALIWANSTPKNVRLIREIKIKKDWSFLELYNYESESGVHLQLSGPCNLILSFYNNNIKFWDPLIRYSLWFDADEVYRDEWRKYLQHIVNLFGGDRVIYLPDSNYELEKYLDFEGTFESMEEELQKKYGSPKYNFSEVVDNLSNSYYIDNFKSIDWSRTVPLDTYLPEPDDASSTNYDLFKYSFFEELKKLDFDSEELLKRQTDGKIHFYHIAVKEGLLCIHTGIVGESENLEVKVDKYAPFIFDEMIEAVEKLGYLELNGMKLSVTLEDLDNVEGWWEALKEFDKELLWKGLGFGGGAYGDSILNIKWFYILEDTLSINLLLELGKKHNAEGKIRVLVINDEDEKVVYKT